MTHAEALQDMQLMKSRLLTTVLCSNTLCVQLNENAHYYESYRPEMRRKNLSLTEKRDWDSCNTLY